jgi:hypothetical protein
MSIASSTKGDSEQAMPNFGVVNKSGLTTILNSSEPNGNSWEQQISKTIRKPGQLPAL